LFLYVSNVIVLVPVLSIAVPSFYALVVVALPPEMVLIAAHSRGLPSLAVSACPSLRAVFVNAFAHIVFCRALPVLVKVLVATPLSAVAKELLPAVRVCTLVLLVSLVALIGIPGLVGIRVMRVRVVRVVCWIMSSVRIMLISRLVAHVASVALAARKTAQAPCALIITITGISFLTRSNRACADTAIAVRRG